MSELYPVGAFAHIMELYRVAPMRLLMLLQAHRRIRLMEQLDTIERPEVVPRKRGLNQRKKKLAAQLKEETPLTEEALTAMSTNGDEQPKPEEQPKPLIFARVENVGEKPFQVDQNIKAGIASRANWDRRKLQIKTLKLVCLTVIIRKTGTLHASQ